MKLRNKKTGEIIDTKRQVMAPIVVRTDDREINGYSSIAELCAEWEDHAPKEPLIKDESVRKAVRVWAEANDVLEVFADRIGDGTYIELYDEDDGRRRISAHKPAGLKTGEAYTIAELCGEDEKCGN